MGNSRPTRNTGCAAKRETIVSKTALFKAFLEENRELIIQRIQRETGQQKVIKKLINLHAREVWGSMSEQQQMVYAV